MTHPEFSRDWWKARREPFFVYRPERVRENVAFFRAQMAPQLPTPPKIFLSLKANSNAALLKALDSSINGYDCSSPIEFESLVRAKIDPKRITVSGPGKTDDFLKLLGMRQPLALHIDNADEFLVLEKTNFLESGRWTLRHRGLSNSVKLGMTSDEITDLVRRGPTGKWAGLHVYLGRESFDARALNTLLDELKVLVIGKEKFRAPDFALYLGLGLPQRDLVSLHKDSWQLPALNHFPVPVHFEGGRFFMMDAGAYGAPILSVKKRSGERPVVLIDGGLQHLNGPLVAPLGLRREVICTVYREGQPVTGPKAEQLVFGSLCLANDVLHTHLPLPDSLARGDWIVFESFGAYGITASVHSFIGQTPASEWVFDNGQMLDATPGSYKPYQLSF